MVSIFPLNCSCITYGTGCPAGVIVRPARLQKIELSYRILHICVGSPQTLNVVMMNFLCQWIVWICMQISPCVGEFLVDGMPQRVGMVCNQDIEEG